MTQHIGIIESNAQQREQDALISLATLQAKHLLRVAGSLEAAIQRAEAAQKAEGFRQEAYWHEVLVALGARFCAQCGVTFHPQLDGTAADSRVCSQGCEDALGRRLSVPVTF